MSPMRSSPLRRLAFLLASSSLLFTAFACDIRPDQCQLHDNACEGNVAKICERPGAESRLETRSEDCGSTRTCVAVRQTDGDGRPPVCARKDAPSCPTVGENRCEGKVVARCIALGDGRSTWVDSVCANACVTTPDGGAYCS